MLIERVYRACEFDVDMWKIVISGYQADVMIYSELTVRSQNGTNTGRGSGERRDYNL